MSYVDGFVVPVPHGRKDAYREMAARSFPMFRKFGALQIVECWGDNLPRGKTTDFYMAVKAGDDENVVFSWILWPSKAVRDRAWERMQEEMKPPADMPFDGKRMFWGGFEILLDSETMTEEAAP